MSPEGQKILVEQGSLLTDKDAQVRLQGILCIADMAPSDAGGQLIAGYLASAATDRWEGEAATAAAATHGAFFLKALGPFLISLQMQRLCEHQRLSRNIFLVVVRRPRM